jgi:hypothetical protein
MPLHRNDSVGIQEHIQLGFISDGVSGGYPEGAEIHCFFLLVVSEKRVSLLRNFPVATGLFAKRHGGLAER